jgi:hypothetical protein
VGGSLILPQRFGCGQQLDAHYGSLQGDRGQHTRELERGGLVFKQEQNCLWRGRLCSLVVGCMAYAASATVCAAFHTSSRQPAR